MTPLTVELRRGRDDWFALECHRWELVYGRRDFGGWVVTGVALIVAVYLGAPGVIFGTYLVRYAVRVGAVPFAIEESHVAWFLCWLAAVALVVAVMPARRRWSARRRARDRVNRMILSGERPGHEVVAVTLDARGWAEGDDRLRPWTEFFRFDVTEAHAFVLLDDGEWLVMPAASFADGRAFHNFTSRAVELAAAAKAAPTTGGPASLTTVTPDGAELRYRLTAGDYRALFEYVWDANIASRTDVGSHWSDRVNFSISSSVLEGAVLLVPVLAALYALGFAPEVWRAVGWTAGLVAAYAIVKWLTPAARRRHFLAVQTEFRRKAVGDDLTADLTVVIGRDGIVERTHQSDRDPKEERAAWGDIGVIAATKRHLLIQLRDRGWLIVPQAAFESEDQFHALVETVRRFRAAAQPAAPTAAGPRP